MTRTSIHSCAELIRYIDEVGFLPLLDMGIGSWAADVLVDEDCQYHPSPDGGMDWPLWEWKGSVIQESGCAYGKFFLGKAAFVSSAWWPDFCNWRRAARPPILPGSIEENILLTLRDNGSMITRELRAACGFTGGKMRGRFDGFVSRLQMGCRIVTEDFVYPTDRHRHQYGWGWSLLTTPENLLGHDACHVDRSPEESYRLLTAHFHKLLPTASTNLISRLLG